MTSFVNKEGAVYDLIVLGAGPAGLTAAIYGGRAQLSTLVIEPKVAGGEITLTDSLENYPGFPEGIGGFEFGMLLEQHATRFGAEIVYADVDSVQAEGSVKEVSTASGVYRGRTLIIATGTVPRYLGVPGEELLIGKGISFCATCDAPLFKNKKTAVIGGGDAAVEEALYLARFAEEVHLIHRRNELRAATYLQNRFFAGPNVKFVGETIVQEFRGEKKLESILLQNVVDKSTSELEVDGAFLFVGRTPSTGFIGGIEKDESGFIKTSEEMETSIPGVFAAGDVRSKLLRQVVTAAADGAIAATMALKYLELAI